MAETARLFDLGRRDYRSTLALQRVLHDAVADGRTPQTWLVVEHPPVITLGRNAKANNILGPRSELAAHLLEEVERLQKGRAHG